VSRFGGREPPPGLDKLMLALLFSLRGTALLYQGEELGLPEANIRRDQIRDPVGDLYWPYTGGRDGCRTPMPWAATAPNLGFTSGTPWLPVSPKHRAMSVSEQEQQADSALGFARRFLAFRRESAPLRWGDLTFVDAPAPVLAFVRSYENQSLICLFNMGEEVAEFSEEFLGAAKAVAIGFGDATVAGNDIRLGSYACWFGSLSNASSTASMGSNTQR
jgi:alpha-glucosidase